MPHSREPLTIGVLALQGAVRPHQKHIEATGAQFTPVKTQDDLDHIDGLIIPGGESTTMLKLIDRFGLEDTLTSFFQKKPAWGICAGAILMAGHVTNPTQKSFGVLPMTVRRNGYGRQLESHYSYIDGYEVAFIRAPVIEDPGKTEILARHGNDPVWVQNGCHMATTFHPELNPDTPSPMHRRFTDIVHHATSPGANELNKMQSMA